MAGNRSKTGTLKRDKQRVARFASEEVPLYYQLGTILREMILSGQYAGGDQIPTEVQLVQDYGVSRITVRQSLRLLEEEGLIRREVGRGTFVSDHIPAQPSLKMDGNLDDLVSLGMATSVKLLDFRTVAATADDAEALQVRPGDPLIRCTRLRYYHQEPYSLIVNLLPQPIGGELTRKYLRKGSILRYIEDKLGMHLRDAEQTVQATLADATLAKMLHTRIGSSLLFVHRIVRTDDGTPVERVRTYYRGELFSISFHSTRDPEHPQTGTGWVLKDPGKSPNP